MSETPRIMTVAEAKEELQRKGWTITALATWWGFSRVYVGRVVNSDSRPRHFDDAIRGLPRCPGELR